MSRTTLSLDDDILPQVREYAGSRSLSLGKAVSELVRRGMQAPAPTRKVNGLEIFDLPANSPRISSRRVKELEAQTE